MTYDLTFDVSFSSPLATITACSVRGIKFLESHLGAGVVSCEVKQSMTQTIYDEAVAEGLTVF